MFRECLNIENTDHIPWEQLTHWEKTVELFFTPERFEYIESIHGPTSNAYRPIVNERGNRLNSFFPTDYESSGPYVFYIQSDDNIVSSDFRYLSHRGTGIGHFPDLRLDLFFQYPFEEIRLDNVYTFTHLTTPTEDVVLF